MRLTCGVDIVNRLLPSQNLKKAARAKTSQLSIGKKPGSGSLKDNTLWLMICTAADKNGTKYQINGNILQVFTKFVQEGKATIRFNEPEHDVCISKADPLHLKSFLCVLKSGVQGKNLDKITLSSLAPASAKNFEPPKTQMVIRSRREYPMTTNFPSTLESLQVSECGMKRIDSRIFSLKRLSKLDLSNNSIEKLPDEIARLELLRDLRLCFNDLVTFPATLCMKPSMQEALCSLDLRNNKLQLLPLHICELKNLWLLKVDNNELAQLPPTIGRLGKLRILTACSNKLKFLPAGFLKLQLEEVDVSNNEFHHDEDFVLSAETVELPSLMECCARSVRKNRVQYDSENILPHLCRYLDAARQCWCGNYCFQSIVRFTTKTDLRRAMPCTGTVSVDVTWGTTVPIEGYLCSQDCLNKFRKNPLAYWR